MLGTVRVLSLGFSRGAPLLSGLGVTRRTLVVPAPHLPAEHVHVPARGPQIDPPHHRGTNPAEKVDHAVLLFWLRLFERVPMPINR